MNSRNRNIDILRAMATLLVVVYHSWVLTGAANLSVPVVRTLIRLGGEVGVTLFFLLSGYGIYCSLNNMNSKGGIGFVSFMKKRLKRVVPQYYLNLIVCLLLTSNAVYLAKDHIWNVLSHFVFLHNFYPDWHGAINGVLWTMGVIVQFYIVAIPLHWCIKKNCHITAALSVIFTIAMKYVVFNALAPDYGTSYNFIAGRQLFTSLDNFVLGMYVAHLMMNRKDSQKLSALWNNVIALFIALVGFVGMYEVCTYGLTHGIHTANYSGYLWHSLVAVFLAVMMFGFGCVSLNAANPICKCFLWIAKYEYGIYLWHIIMIRALIAYSPAINNMINSGRNWLVYGVFVVLTVGIGFVMSKALEK